MERSTVAAAITRHPREFVGIIMATGATVAIFVNALFLQHGPHPAPIFAARPPLQHLAPIVTQQAPAAPTPQVQETRTPGQIISDIQRELHKRGYYDGAVDGIWGAKTDAATRDFLQAAGLKLDVTPNAALLNAITSAAVKPVPPAPIPAAAPARHDPIAELIAPSPSKRVLAVQRALADFGYGQIKPTGALDSDTRAAVEKFEREHSLPIDGQISDRFVRELAAMTGRPLE
ncbi:MAG TPA: peptidoglycan-binding protein [Pseudolabrys sp.]|nr:peptidoglycan-binding protein [Pseudolabrys sp.]